MDEMPEQRGDPVPGEPQEAHLFELALAPEGDEERGFRPPPEPHAERGPVPPAGDGPLGRLLDDESPAEPVQQTPIGFWNEPQPRVVRRSLGTVILASLIAVLLGAGAGAVGAFYALREQVPAGGVVRVSPPIADPPAEPANAAAAVAAAVLPSIVQIDILGAFGQGAVGSGVIYRSDGYIVTNDHVIRGADQIEVRLATGERLPAVVVGSAAPAVDIAVLKVARDRMSSATFGSTETLRVGDLAVAIGSPFGLEATVTSGVISALHRNAIRGASVGVPDAIQTDAAINPGNSGGALANAKGEVVGINTAIIGGDTGGNVGIGFAIPVEMVRRVADQIIATGSARLAYLGIQGHSLPEGGGALIVDVPRGGPAHRAGLRAEDVIVEMDGRPINSFEELVSYLLTKDVGDRVEIAYVRGEERRTTTATLDPRPEE